MLLRLVLNYLVFPASIIWWKLSAPIIKELLPVEKEVVLVHPGSEVQFDPIRQYPILDFIGLVERHGYDAEELNVTTSDGYILRMHRISAGPGNPKTPGKPAVILQHGIFQTSDHWVLQGPKTDLAFLLVDAGYDVFVTNIRGNPYSQDHLWIDTNSQSYWTFSYHEMALYDMPAFIDLALNITGNEKLTYIGFSMGTTISYVLLSTIPEYNDKVDMVYSMGPAAYLANLGRSRNTEILTIFGGVIKDVIEYFNVKELYPQNAVSADLGKRFCSNSNKITQPPCVQFLCQFGLNCKTFNRSVTAELAAYFPVGASYKTFLHYFQNSQKRTFQQYDYGKHLNKIKYGQEVAPYYNLSKIQAPVSLWYGNHDYYVYPKSIVLLSKVLKNCTIQMVDAKKWNHLDFFWAKDVRRLVFDKLPILQKK